MCLGKLSDGKKLCCVCGSGEDFCPYANESPTSKSSDLNKCDKCSKHFHKYCMPHAKHYKTTHKWHCLNCHNIKASVLKTNLQLNNSDKLATAESSKQTKRSSSSNLNRAKKSRGLQSDTDIEHETKQHATNTSKKSTSKSNKLLKGGKIKKNNENEHDVSMSSQLSDESKCYSEQENDELSEVAQDTELAPKQKTTKLKKKLNSQSKQKKTPHVAAKRNKLLSVSIMTDTSANSSPLMSTPNQKQREKELNTCKTVINEMCKNDNAWPFMKKVDEQSYPDYYELIKEPMDLETIKTKLKAKKYKTKEQFAYDCRLIFDNCEYFNEDDSQIGQAGHKLRAYFETKWLKLFE